MADGILEGLDFMVNEDKSCIKIHEGEEGDGSLDGGESSSGS